MHRFSLSIILHVTNWIAIYEAIHIPCGKATAKRLEAVPRVGYPPNFKKVMAVPKSMPWNVIVQADVTMCGGVLIRLNDDFNYTDTVLTSSQCFFKNFNERVDHANVKVHLGAHKLPISRDTLTVGVKHVTTTPFTENDYHKDLAVVTLHGNVEISEKIRPICLPEKDVEFTTPAILWLVGWNTIDGDGFPSTKVPFLMQMPVFVIKPSTCKNIFTYFSIHDHICGRYVDPYLFNITKNVDYGSPLVGSNEDALYVVGTFNGHATFPNKTGSILLFSKVSTAVEWIIRSSNPSSFIVDGSSIVLTTVNIKKPQRKKR
ncbi:Brain-specific serine protease [Trichinella spiralis]|uniref:Brain-specific serine protease n=1 Tax=Trichinella spiralis TaxID=6334 RepID=A0ABR3KUH4_TRISP